MRRRSTHSGPRPARREPVPMVDARHVLSFFGMMLGRFNRIGITETTRGRMWISFTCENCGKHFQVDERAHGRRGRCSDCGHVMRIPGPDGESMRTLRPLLQRTAGGPPFHLSPPDHSDGPARSSPPPPPNPPRTNPRCAHHRRDHHDLAGFRSRGARTRGIEHVRFDLLDDDADPG